MIGNTPADKTLDTEVAAPLKYLSNLCRSLDLPLINCEMELDLSWPKDFIISEILRAAAVAANRSNPARPATLTIIGIFHIHSTKLYVLVVTLSTNDNIKFPEKMKKVFKRTVLWNKYRSEMTTQLRNSNLDYMIDSTFRNINRLFVLSFKNGSNDPTRGYFDKFFIPLVKIKDFIALIDNKQFFHQLVKNKQEAYEKLVEKR